MSDEAPRPAVEVESLSLRFGGHQALSDVSLTVSAGERLVLLGPSGSGKSSLVRSVIGLEAPQSGRISIFGECVTGDPGAMRRARLRMGMIFQGFNLYSNRTALENVAFALRQLRGLSGEAARQAARRQLERVGCLAVADQFPFQLSGGQQQRVALARSLAMEPDILLLDEPTSALDPELVQSVLDLIMRAVAGGRTALCVTHEIGFARRFADRIVFMDDGRIVEQGPPGELLDAPESARLRRFLDQVLH